MRHPARATLLALLAVTLSACGPKSERPGDAATLTAGSDTAGCGFQPVMVHDNPDNLMAEYLRRDGDGAFTLSDSWRDQAMACPAHAPGWDAFTLISAYSSTSLGASADTARYLVRYSRIGYLEQDSAWFFVRRAAGEEQDTVVLARTAFGWRVGDWDTEPHLLPAGALRLGRIRPLDRKRLAGQIPW